VSHEVTTVEFEAFEWLPLPVTMKVHPSRELLNEWLAEEGVTFDDEREEGVTIHLNVDDLFLCHIAHEAGHAALFIYADRVLTALPNARASAHIRNHDESIPSLIGNLTALLVYWLRAEGFTLDPED
jgi:hypothetical protein